MVLSLLGQINKVWEEVSAVIILVSHHNAGVTHARIWDIQFYGHGSLKRH